MVNYEQIYDGLISSNLEERKDAVANLYNLYFKSFTRRLKFKFLNLDTSMIEDILQDSFLKIIEKKAKPKDKHAIVGWLNTIVINTAIDKCRQLKRRSDERSVDYEGNDENNPLINSLEFSKNESLDESRCIRKVLLKYAQEHDEEFEIYDSFRTKIESTQKSLSDFYGRSLSSIKKICAQTEKELMALTQPCLENN